MSNKSKKSSNIRDFQRLANDKLLDSEARESLFSKLAGSRMDRKTVDKELAKARKWHGKARNECRDAKSQLGALQDRVQKAEDDVNAARDRMVSLNDIGRTMDLIGADEVKPERDGDYSYVVDGQRMHADTSDVNNVSLKPWKEHVQSRKDSNMADGEEPEAMEEEGEPFDLVDELRGMTEGTDGEDDPLAFIDSEDDEWSMDDLLDSGVWESGNETDQGPTLDDSDQYEMPDYSVPLRRSAKRKFR